MATGDGKFRQPKYEGYPSGSGEDDDSGLLNRDGSNSMTGNLDMDNNDIDNAGNVNADSFTAAGTLINVNPVSAVNVVRSFETVALMQAANDLTVGQLARTAGYNESDDSLGETYLIVAAATGVADGDTFIDLLTHQAQRLTVNQDKANRKNKLLNLFGSGRRDVGLYGMFYNSSVAVEPWLLSHIGEGKYISVSLREEGDVGPPLYEVRTLGNIHVVQLYQSAGPDTGSIVITDFEATGGNWSARISSTQAFDGTYKYNSTTSDYYEWTTPADTTMVGQRGNHLADGGLCLVEINGDATLATNLPTAQDLVDNGTIAALGTLNATDRILDCNELDDYDYLGMSGNSDVAVMFANDLEPGVHTVRVTVTGEKATASTGFRLYYSGVIYRTLHTTLKSENVWGMGSNDFNGISNQHGGGLIYLDTFSSDQRVAAGNSVYEYALHLLPDTATTSTYWEGNGHGNEDQTAITYYVDGVARTLTGQVCHTGDEVVVVREAEIFHPEIGAGATPVANSLVEYRIHDAGLLVTIQIDWLTSGTNEGGYIHMFPFANSFNKGNSVALNSDDITMDADDGSFVLNSKADMLYAWQDTGEYAVGFHVPDLEASNQNFRYCGSNFAEIQDRNLGDMNKAYFSLGDESLPFTSGETLRASVNYLFGIFGPGAANRHFAKG